jgi:starvation-inducible DNA-binding protein
MNTLPEIRHNRPQSPATLGLIVKFEARVFETTGHREQFFNHSRRSFTMAIDIGINDKDRASIAESLSRMLADSYILYLKTHNFHWNVTGPMFQALHNLFMVQYTEQWNALDLIAERIRALGHPAPGSYKRYVELSSIEEENGVPSATDMIRQLVAGQEAVARTARAAFKVADAADDQPTADLLTQRMEVHEKNAWMLRVLLEDGGAQSVPAVKAKARKK